MNTDRLRTDLLSSIRSIGNEELATTYLEAYEATRAEHGVPRIPLVLKTMVKRYNLTHDLHNQLAAMFHTFPYQSYIYAGAEQALEYLKQFGRVIILSDGDSLFQSQKVYKTTIASLVDDIIILPNKIAYFDDLSGYYPAKQYVFIDDKQKVLDAARTYFKEQATTILVQQGRYADMVRESAADTVIASIADIPSLSFS